MDSPPRVAKGTWEIGPLTAPSRLRPPTARLASHDARDLRTGQPVEAVLLRPPWDREPAVRRGFLSGIESLARLDHPTIAHVLDILDEDGLVGFITDGRERRYVTPDRGHSWTCST